jgi:hypothetical protein
MQNKQNLLVALANSSTNNNTTLAQYALALHANNTSSNINANAIVNLLANKSVTFAQVLYVTQIATAAAHKNVNIVKVVNANVQLFANIKSVNLYATQVMRSANKLNPNANVTNFVTANASYTHNANCYSLVTNKKTNAQYLYAIYNSVTSSTYFINNVVATKQQVAQYLTASASASLLQNDNTVYNATNNVTHNLTLRTIKLSNLIAVKANAQVLTM